MRGGRTRICGRATGAAQNKNASPMIPNPVAGERKQANPFGILLWIEEVVSTQSIGLGLFLVA